MDHVRPVLAQNVCDSTREEEIIIGFATAISRIFVGKEIELMRSAYLHMYFFRKKIVSSLTYFHY